MSLKAGSAVVVAGPSGSAAALRAALGPGLTLGPDAVSRLWPLGDSGLEGWVAVLPQERALVFRAVALAALEAPPRPAVRALAGYGGTLIGFDRDATRGSAGRKVLLVDAGDRGARNRAAALLSAGADVDVGWSEGSVPVRRAPAGAALRGEVAGAEGHVVRFADGGVGRYDAVVTRLRRSVTLPALDPGLVDWEDGRPRLLAGLLAPGLANLYVHGLERDPGERRRRARLMAAMDSLQGELDHPLTDDLIGVVPASSGEAEDQERRSLRRLERSVRRRARTRGLSLVLQPGAHVPLDAARVA